MKINSKTLGIKLFSEGLFGNNLKTWHSIKEFIQEPDKPSTIAIRYKGEGGSPFCNYDIPVMTLWAEGSNKPEYLPLFYWNLFVRQGANPKKLYINDSSNDDSKLLIQGEVYESHRGLELRYSTVKKKMRLALAEKEEYAYGLKAKFILKHYMDARSFENIITLLECYPGHVIEFSTWGYKFGSTGKHNTIIWEVRNY